jgi:hypothetical protein
MSKAKLFVLHDEIDKWLHSMEVDLQSDSISLPDLPVPMSMEPAIHVTRQVAGEEDTSDLIGKILVVSRLDEGVEYFQNSLIAGDNAYEAVEGFLISSEPPKEEAAAEPPAAGEKAPAQVRDEAPTDIDIPLVMDSGLPTEPEEAAMEPEEAAAPKPVSGTQEGKAPEDGKDASAEEGKDASPEDMLARLILEKLK